MVEIGQVYGGFEMKEDAEYMDNKGCCGPAMKVWLIICNVILLLLAVASLGIGIWVQTQPGFAWTAGSVGVGLIMIGVFLLLLALLGIFAALKKSKCLHAIYGTLLTIFFIAELAALIVAVAATTLVITTQNEMWKTMLPEQKHALGMFFGCCGVDESQVAEGERKYSVARGDGTIPTTCLAAQGESDPKESGTWTSATGVCEIFGLDYKSPDADKVDYVSFPKYSATFLGSSSCRAADNNNFAEFDNCRAMDITACGLEAKCTWVSNGLCTRPADDKWNVVDGKLELPIPQQCLCPLVADGNRPSQECRQARGEIPLCDSEDGKAVYPFNVGISDDWANVEGNSPGLSAPMAACYAKLELWLVEGMTPIIIIAFIFIYQLVQVIFSWMLVCECCNNVLNKKKKDAEQGATGI